MSSTRQATAIKLICLSLILTVFILSMDKHNINLKAAEAIGWSLNLDFDKWYLTAKMETK